MTRDYRFDVGRVLCMTYIVAFAHLYGYIYNVKSAYFIPECAVLADACLGLFTFTSGYLLGSKYSFLYELNDVWRFYRKRLLRIIPLFVIASFTLYFIGFNNLRATVNGILCISPFVTPRPLTLWYIPVILLCYLFTPLICRRSFLWRFSIASILILLFAVLSLIIPSLDWRLQFNLQFFLVGLVSAPYFDWKFEKAPYLKWIVIIVFVGMLTSCFVHPIPSFLRKLFSGVGVFAALFVCEWLSKIIYSKSNSLARLVLDMSYASLACYLFHRFFFWIGEAMWNPLEYWMKWLFMIGVVYPIMLFCSIYIQKGYDKILNNIQKSV